MIDYEFQSEPWRCHHPERIKADLGETVTPEWLHGAVQHHSRLWRIARRLYGLRPVVPDPDQADPDDLKDWSPNTLGQALGLTPKNLQGEVNAIRGMVESAGRARSDHAAHPEPTDRQAPADNLFEAAESRGDFPDDDKLLRHYGLWIEAMTRSDRQWLADRARDWRQALDHRQAQAIARQALLNEFEIRRMRSALLGLNPNDKEDETKYRLMSQSVQEAEKAYRQQLDQLDKVVPWMGLAGRGVKLSAALADCTRAIQEYYKDGTRHLIDGIHTAAEVELLMRMSEQAPHPKYRLGWVAHANAAIAGIFDPNWKNPFPKAVTRRLDLAFKEAYAAAAREDGVHIPDLLKEGEEGEFQDRLAGFSASTNPDD